MTQLSHSRTRCRLCNSPDLWMAVPLRALPVASPNVGRVAAVVETAPADVWQCRSCGFLQLATVVDPEFQYRNFRYVTGISRGLTEHFETLIGELARAGEIGAGRCVLDVGSNDGSLLRIAGGYGAGVLGIDPAAAIAKAASDAGIPTLAEFFTAELGRRIAVEHGRFDVVISNNTVANIDNLDDFFDGLQAVLAPGGLVVIETQYALDVVERTLLDVIYHEHVSYFAVLPMQRFLAARGLELIDAKRIAPKGGSIRFLIQRAGAGRAVAPGVERLVEAERAGGLYGNGLFDDFNARIAEVGQRLRDRLQLARKTSGRALAYGSSVGCAALVHYFDLGGVLDAVYDDQPLTDALQTPLGAVPVRHGRLLIEEPPTDVVVLAWRYAASIASAQSRYLAKGGRFYHALPTVGPVAC